MQGRPSHARAFRNWVFIALTCAAPPSIRRLLGLDPEAQGVLFDFYSATLDALMERARREGTLGAFGMLGLINCWPSLQTLRLLCLLLWGVQTGRCKARIRTLNKRLPNYVLHTDEGIVDIRARSVALAGEPQVLLRDAVTGAATGVCSHWGCTL